MLGKANLSKFANSGHFSESDYGRVWNAFDPSWSPIGSSGGSATSLASSFAAAVMGTQSGDSLWGLAGGASLYSLRGTDGMQSSAGVMPLAQIQDYVGFMAQSVDDLASLLNAAAVDNPDDVLDNVSNGHRPGNWTAALSTGALRGKVIGVPANAFDDPFGTTETSDALRAQFSVFQKAGATIKQIPAAPAAPSMGALGSVWTEGNYQGWKEWLEDHPDSPVGLGQLTTATSGWTSQQQRAVEAHRTNYRNLLATWMDDNGVDTVLYPTELSDIHLNDTTGSSFGRRDPQSSDAGVPTMIFPAGVNSHGQPVGFQLQGKAFQDSQLLGYAYAYAKIANGRVLPTTTPALKFDADSIPSPVEDLTPAPVARRTLTVIAKKVSASRRGRIAIEVGCASAEATCTGKVRIVSASKKSASKRVTVKSGHKKVVRFTVSQAARKRLARGNAVKVRVILTGTGATTATKPVVVTVRR